MSLRAFSIALFIALVCFSDSSLVFSFCFSCSTFLALSTSSFLTRSSAAFYYSFNSAAFSLTFFSSSALSLSSFFCLFSSVATRASLAAWLIYRSASGTIFCFEASLSLFSKVFTGKRLSVPSGWSIGMDLDPWSSSDALSLTLGLTGYLDCDLTVGSFLSLASLNASATSNDSSAESDSVTLAGAAGFFLRGSPPFGAAFSSLADSSLPPLSAVAFLSAGLASVESFFSPFFSSEAPSAFGLSDFSVFSLF